MQNFQYVIEIQKPWFNSAFSICMTVHRHVLTWQSQYILKVFFTLTWKQVFSDPKLYFTKLEYCFLLESINSKRNIFNQTCQRPFHTDSLFYWYLTNVASVTLKLLLIGTWHLIFYKIFKSAITFFLIGNRLTIIHI